MSSVTAESISPPVRTRRPALSPRWFFKVVDVCTGDTVVEDVDAYRTVDALSAVESIFDVWVYVWNPDIAMWRQLSPGEQRILWDFRGR